MNIINNEEIEAFDIDYDLGKIDEMEKPFILKRSNLNRKNNIIFIHDLKSAWREPLEEFYLIDDKENNIVICHNDKQKHYTLPYEDIKKLIEIISKKAEIFQRGEIAFPPVLDGTSHSLYIRSNDKDVELSCFNLWYWLDDGSFDDKHINTSAEKIEYTKHIINIIKSIQKILNENNIKYKILSG